MNRMILISLQRVACLMMVVLLFACDFSAKKSASGKAVVLQRFPYLQSAQADSLSILWRTSVGAASKVRYKATGAADWQEQSGTVKVINDTTVENLVTLRGLQYGTTYAYQVLTDGQQLADGEELRFRSSVSPTDSVFVFFAAGDIGEAVEDGGTPDKLGKTMWAHNSDYQLGVLLGDIIYPDGQAEGYDQHLFPYFKNVFARTPVWPVPGNHDWGSDYETNYALQWKLPGNEHYYSFDQGKVHFVAIDTKMGGLYNYDEQVAWLRSDLAAAQGKYDWLIVFLHHNGKSCTYKNDYEGVVSLYPIFDQYNVDMVLNGHAHTYERLKPMNGKGEVATQQTDHSSYLDPEGFISITAGSGGKLRGVGTDPKPFTPDPSNCKYPDLVAHYHHTWAYLEVEVSGKTLKARTVAVQDGTILDSFEVRKTK